MYVVLKRATMQGREYFPGDQIKGELAQAADYLRGGFVMLVPDASADSVSAAYGGGRPIQQVTAWGGDPVMDQLQREHDAKQRELGELTAQLTDQHKAVAEADAAALAARQELDAARGDIDARTAELDALRRQLATGPAEAIPAPLVLNPGGRPEIDQRPATAQQVALHRALNPDPEQAPSDRPERMVVPDIETLNALRAPTAAPQPAPPPPVPSAAPNPPTATETAPRPPEGAEEPVLTAEESERRRLESERTTAPTPAPSSEPKPETESPRERTSRSERKR